MEKVWKFTAKNGEEITLRPAVPEDADDIIGIVRSTAEERSYILMEMYGKDAKAEREYIRTLDRGKNLLLVAIVNGVLIGILAALQAGGGRRPQTAHILSIGLHIDKTHRGLGIGSQMLAYVNEWAKEKEFKKLEASIFTAHKRSLHLFSRAGFREEGVREKRIRIGKDYIDEVLVGKVLE